jgi:photosystem II stability/assembly factor-like uncharacterized protein
MNDSGRAHSRSGWRIRRAPAGLHSRASHRRAAGLALALLAGPAIRPAIAQAPDEPLLRMHYLRDQRAYPFADVPLGALQRGWAQLEARWPQFMLRRRGLRGPFVVAAPPGGQTAWTPIGPAPIGTAATGRLSTIAIHPTDPSILYVGGAQGGVWKSVDSGANWTPMSDGECSLAMGALAIDPTTPDIIYAGTGELHFSGDSYYGCGILRSTDGGTTWTQLGASHFDTNIGGARVSAILIDPSTAGSATATTVYAATSVGLYRSTDSGLNWTRTLEGIATDMVLDPVTPTRLWAAIGSPNGDARNGVYHSSDGGVTWTKQATFPAADVGRIALAIAPSAPATLYAAIQRAFSASAGAGELLGIYRTTDGGSNWGRVNAENADCGTQCWYDLVIRVDPINPSVVWFGGVFMYRSTDAGATFRRVLGTMHVDQHTLAFDPQDPTVLYAGNDGGIYRTHNAGVSWESINSNLALTQFYPGVSPHPFDPAVVLAGTQDNGTLEYSGVPTWQTVLGGDGGFTAIDASDPTISYAETQWSQNSGFSGPRRRIAPGNYVRMVAGINAADRGLFIPPLVIDPVDPAVLYFGTFRLYRSFNRSLSWTAISTDLSRGNGRVSAIAPAPSDNSTIWVGTSDGNVQVTRNVGTSWNLRTAGLPDRFVTDIAVDRLAAGTATITVSGFNTGHVFRSTDFGVSWRDISGTLPDVPVNAVLDIGGRLLIGTDLGIFASDDVGATWTPFMAGLPNVAVFDLAYSNETGIAVAGTHGRGMYAIRPLAAASVVLDPDNLAFTAILDTVRLGATVFDSTGAAIAEPFVSWRSLDPAVVTVVAGGGVRSRGNGSTSVIAAMAGVADTTTVAVEQIAAALSGLPDSTFLVEGETRDFEATATDSNDQPVLGAQLVWTSSEPGVATVDASGRVRAVAAGNTWIRVRLGALTDSTGILVDVPSTALLDAVALPGETTPRSAAGTRLPLLRLRFSVSGFEPVEITRLGFDVTGDDPGARLLILRDLDDDGVIDPADTQLASYPVSLSPGASAVVTVSPSGFRVAGDSTASLIVALGLSGDSPNGATFQARFLPAQTATIGQRSGRQNRLEQPAQPVASDLVSTTLLAVDEVLSLSENPVRSASLVLNFAANPQTAAIFTVNGRLVLDLKSRLSGEGRIEWDLRNSDGTPVAPGVYLVIFDVAGTRYQEKLIVLRRSAVDAEDRQGGAAPGGGTGHQDPADPLRAGRNASP